MKQIVQNYKTGKLELANIPTPRVIKNSIIIKNQFSVISVGTEKSVIETAKNNLMGKAIKRPDLFKQVMIKAMSDGIVEAYTAAMTRLDKPVPLGYSSAGIVLDVGEGINEFKKGDKVACAGSGYASHAEVVSVPRHLCAKISDNVDFESASFIGLGGIAMEALRVAHLGKGDKVAVIGLGLLGQLAIQLLKAEGCHAFGIDISPGKVKMAIENGAEGGVVLGKQTVLDALREKVPEGFKSIIIMAATKSNQPLELAAEIAKERARIVATGLVGLNIPRRIFFAKELELVVSKAWGPETSDDEKVWTAKKNFEMFLQCLSEGSVRVKHLITHRFPIEQALKAYDMILNGKEPYIGVLISYPSEENKDDFSKVITTTRPTGKERSDGSNKLTIGFIGAGLFAKGFILPILKSQKEVRLKSIASTTGISGQHTAEKFGFENFTTDYKEILNDGDIKTVFIMTRHGSHAELVAEAIKAGKNIFVEKPLCINESQLKDICAAYNAQSQADKHFIMVGFNRRFSPFAHWLKDQFTINQAPLSIHYTINAGYVPPESWVHDSNAGGGRIVGEVCHFIDLIQYFTNSVSTEVFAESLDSKAYKTSDNVTISLKMSNGSIGSILYVASGNKRFPRERIEIFGGGNVGIIDNFKSAVFINQKVNKKIRKWISLDMGYKNEILTLINAIKGGSYQPVQFNEYVHTTLTTFAIERSLKEGIPIKVKI